MIIEASSSGDALVGFLSLWMEGIYSSEFQPYISSILSKNILKGPKTHIKESCYIATLHGVLEFLLRSWTNKRNISEFESACIL